MILALIDSSAVRTMINRNVRSRRKAPFSAAVNVQANRSRLVRLTKAVLLGRMPSVASDLSRLLIKHNVVSSAESLQRYCEKLKTTQRGQRDACLPMRSVVHRISHISLQTLLRAMVASLAFIKTTPTATVAAIHLRTQIANGTSAQ